MLPNPLLMPELLTVKIDTEIVNIELSLEKNNKVLLVGKNGSGKTVILNLIYKGLFNSYLLKKNNYDNIKGSIYIKFQLNSEICTIMRDNRKGTIKLLNISGTEISENKIFKYQKWFEKNAYSSINDIANLFRKILFLGYPKFHSESNFFEKEENIIMLLNDDYLINAYQNLSEAKLKNHKELVNLNKTIEVVGTLLTEYADKYSFQDQINFDHGFGENERIVLINMLERIKNLKLSERREHEEELNELNVRITELFNLTKSKYQEFFSDFFNLIQKMNNNFYPSNSKIIQTKGVKIDLNKNILSSNEYQQMILWLYISLWTVLYSNVSSKPFLIIDEMLNYFNTQEISLLFNESSDLKVIATSVYVLETKYFDKVIQIN